MHNPQPGGPGLSIYYPPEKGWPTSTFGQQVITVVVFHNTKNFQHIQYHLAIVTLLQLLDTSRRAIKLHSISYCLYNYMYPL